MTVRTVRDEADLRRFADLQAEYEHGLPPDLRHGVADLATLKRAYAPPNAAFLATIPPDDSGCVAVGALDASTSVMQRLYVKLVFRKLGVARALVSAAIAHAREHQRRRIVLDTDRCRFRAAYALYLSLGFTETEPYGAVDYASPTYMALELW